MGSRVAEALTGEDDISLAGGVEAPHHPLVGQKWNSAPIVSDDDPYPSADVWVDFSLTQAALVHTRKAAQQGTPIVIGVTGFTREEEGLLLQCSEKTAILWAPNFSLGAAVLEQVGSLAARLAREHFQGAIVELHHQAKKDAPSGTALRLAQALTEAGISPSLHSLRAGGAVGEHTIRLVGRWEEVELTHRVWSRDAFLPLIPHSVRFITHQSPGLYTISDLIHPSDRG